MSNKLVYLGTVTSVLDDKNGNRIRVKIPIDGTKEPKDGWPYAFPLLPKTVQTMPKVGEMVLVILAKTEDREAVRFYIGPVISQPQKMYKELDNAVSSPACLIGLSPSNGLETTTHFKNTFGSFPTVDDVALVGRKSEDVILKDDEINIRCGVRNSADGSENTSMVGDIIFNDENPSYIQLKHQRSKGKKDGSLINLVGGRINLMSLDDAQKITKYMQNYNNIRACSKEIFQEAYKNRSNDEDWTDKVNEKISSATFTEPTYEELTAKLHKLPYGDVLVQILEMIRTAILTHDHKWANEPPTIENAPAMETLKSWGQTGDSPKTLSQLLLSDTVRIS